MKSLRWSRPGVRCGVVAAALVVFTPGVPTSVSAEEKGLAPPTVPAGVTLVEVVRELNASAAQLLWTRLGDAEGRTLLFRADGGAVEVSCVDECAVEFPPLPAPVDAEPFADWSPVRRPDGRLQWAYQSRPLHTWSLEEEPGEVATNVGLAETANLKLAERGRGRLGSHCCPPPEWRVARFEPAQVHRRAGRHRGPARVVRAGRRAHRFRRLHALRCPMRLTRAHADETCAGRGCDRGWLPVAAPALALDVGAVLGRDPGGRLAAVGSTGAGPLLSVPRRICYPETCTAGPSTSAGPWPC